MRDGKRFFKKTLRDVPKLSQVGDKAELFENYFKVIDEVEVYWLLYVISEVQKA